METENGKNNNCFLFHLLNFPNLKYRKIHKKSFNLLHCLNLFFGGNSRFPDANSMASVGQASMQEPHEKQSVTVVFRFRIVFIADEGHALTQASQAIHLE